MIEFLSRFFLSECAARKVNIFLGSISSSYIICVYRGFTGTQKIPHNSRRLCYLLFFFMYSESGTDLKLIFLSFLFFVFKNNWHVRLRMPVFCKELCNSFAFQLFVTIKSVSSRHRTKQGDRVTNNSLQLVI